MRATLGNTYEGNTSNFMYLVIMTSSNSTRYPSIIIICFMQENGQKVRVLQVTKAHPLKHIRKKRSTENIQTEKIVFSYRQRTRFLRNWFHRKCIYPCFLSPARLNPDTNDTV